MFFFCLKSSWSEAMMQKPNAAVIPMIVSKFKLSSLNLQSLSTTQFNGLSEEMISLF